MEVRKSRQNNKQKKKTTNLTTACERNFMYINLIKTVFVDIVRMDMVRLCHAVYANTPV